MIATFVPLAGTSHETIVRIVGSWAAAPGTGNGSMVMGGLVVTDAAVAIGITAIPDPVTEINDDVWAFISSIPFTASLGSIGEQREATFDSRAMRRLEEGQTFAIVMANAGTATANFDVYMRLLAKLAVRS